MKYRSPQRLQPLLPRILREGYIRIGDKRPNAVL